VHQEADADTAAGLDHVGCAVDVHPVKIIRVAPNARLAGGVYDRVAARGCSGEIRQAGDVAANRGQVGMVQMFRRGALKGDDPVAELEELATDGAAEKSAAASDQDVQNAAVSRGSDAGDGSTLHLLRSPFRQFFTADFGIVPDIHREARVEQHGADALRDGVSLCQLQQIEMDTLPVHR
jgi:hypothetical protein